MTEEWTSPYEHEKTTGYKHGGFTRESNTPIKPMSSPEPFLIPSHLVPDTSIDDLVRFVLQSRMKNIDSAETSHPNVFRDTRIAPDCRVRDKD